MKKLAVVLAVTALSAAGGAKACTDFQIRAADGSVIVARSYEFPLIVDYKVLKIPRGRAEVSRTPDGKTGLSWTSKFGFLGVNAFDDPGAIFGGLNEAGLGVELLWFPGSRYQEPENGPFLAITDLGRWLLGSFATAGEVREALSRTAVVGAFVPQLKQVPGFHVAVHDAAGKNLVITVDIPLGVIREPHAEKEMACELTQWSVIKDLTNRIFYLRSYDNHALRMIDMKKLDFAPGTGVTSLPLAAEHAPEDVTGRMR